MKIKLKDEEKKLIAIAVIAAIFCSIISVINNKTGMAMTIGIIFLVATLLILLNARAVKLIVDFLLSNKEKKKKLLLLTVISAIITVIFYGLYRTVNAADFLLCLTFGGLYIIGSFALEISSRKEEESFRQIIQYYITLRQEKYIKRWKQTIKTIKGKKGE